MRFLREQLQQKEKTHASCVTFETFCTCKPLHCLYLRKTLNFITVKSITENKAIMSTCTISASLENACMQMIHMIHTNGHGQTAFLYKREYCEHPVIDGRTI